MQDEVLSHRLGLLPLTADPRRFDWPSSDWTPDTGTEKDTIEFSLEVKYLGDDCYCYDMFWLQVKCSKGSEPGQYNDSHVTTGEHLVWQPRGDQATWLTNPGPSEKDILINKLRPGHEMDIKMFAVKGIGRDHAKFSPVATAFYRLMPAITITSPVTGDEARKLQKCFSPGVIDIVDNQAKVINPRQDTCSRNIYR